MPDRGEKSNRAIEFKKKEKENERKNRDQINIGQNQEWLLFCIVTAY
jgi:hypothetical protein